MLIVQPYHMPVAAPAIPHPAVQRTMNRAGALAVANRALTGTQSTGTVIITQMTPVGRRVQRELKRKYWKGRWLAYPQKSRRYFQRRLCGHPRYHPSKVAGTQGKAC